MQKKSFMQIQGFLYIFLSAQIPPPIFATANSAPEWSFLRLVLTQSLPMHLLAHLQMKSSCSNRQAVNNYSIRTNQALCKIGNNSTWIKVTTEYSSNHSILLLGSMIRSKNKKFASPNPSYISLRKFIFQSSTFQPSSNNSVRTHATHTYAKQ